MKKVVLLLVSAFIMCAAFAQPVDGPINQEAGKCYAQCVMPDRYETLTEQVLAKEASTRLEVVPAQFETQSESVLAKEAGKRLEVVPAQYETVSEQIIAKPAYNNLSVIPAQFETVSEQVLVTPAQTKWVKGKGDQNCLSANPDDCIVWCLVEVPATYRTVTRTVLKAPATTTEAPVPAQYKTITRSIISQPASVREVEIPAEYKTVTKTVLASPATVREVTIPAEYKTVTKTVLAEKGGTTEWREVLCSNRVTTARIQQIQSALMSRGYNVGPRGADNVMGPDTRNALIKFQKANGLPVGNLNMETLKALGISQ